MRSSRVHVASEQRKQQSNILGIDKMLPEFLDSRSREVQLQKHAESKNHAKNKIIGMHFLI